MIRLTTMTSPIGPLTVAAHEARVCLVHFGADGPGPRTMLERWYTGDAIVADSDPAGAVSALAAYFAGELSAIDRVDVEMNGTAFQRRVWDTLRSVRCGTTTSYAAIAQSIGASNAVRAVGAANGANPVALIVPCHRVIGTNGSLTGYGGGLDRKRWLLQHEGVLLPC